MTVNPLTPIENDQMTKPARIAAYAHNAGFSGDALVIALAIAKAESSWDFNAKGGPNKNGTYDYGLFQINDIHKPTQAEKTMPLPNARRAFSIYKDAGNRFKPWATYNNGAYKKHMKDAQAAVKELQRRGSQWERDTIKNAGRDDHDVTDPPDIPGVDLGGQFDGIVGAIGKFTSGLLGVIIGIVLIALGVVILSKDVGISVATKNLRKVVRK